LKFLHSIASTLATWGPWGILLLALIDSAGIPAVEAVDVLLVATAAANPRLGYWCAGLATLGSTVGCLFLFYLGKKGGEAYFERKTRTGWGKKLRGWFDRYGLLTVFVPTLVPAPLPMKACVLCAGALGTSPWQFLLVVLAARIPRYLAEAYLGAQLGEHSFRYIQDHAWGLLGVAAGLFVFLYFLIKLADRLRRG
jgi:membrane protein DedA with SNARE-associated domain